MKFLIALSAAGVVITGALIAMNYANIVSKISDAVDSFKAKSDELEFPEDDDYDEF